MLGPWMDCGSLGPLRSCASSFTLVQFPEARAHSCSLSFYTSPEHGEAPFGVIAEVPFSSYCSLPSFITTPLAPFSRWFVLYVLEL